ncbi:MAG: hypothetical protein LBC07_02920 [Elusimicrobiota bacterium]|nr:hypothetical protein [Elusimicrobiota bacterium]
MEVVRILGFLLAICTFIGMCIGLIPFLGMLNWFNIPIALIGLILNVIFLIGNDKGMDAMPILGLLLCIAVIFFGVIRLIIGEGMI